jgi:very-short-patch-repair endonuclease
MTIAEKKLWWHLRQVSVEDSHFRRQATIGPYFADFACHEQRLVIEVDGGQHGDANGIALDKKGPDISRSMGIGFFDFGITRCWAT